MLSVVWLHRNSTVKRQNKTEKIQIIQNNRAPVGIWLFYGQLIITQKVIHSGQIQEDTDRCESANTGRIQRASTRVKTGCCFHTWEVWLSCETTASLCNWKHGPPAKRAAALPAWFTSFQISRYQPSDPGQPEWASKRQLSGLKTTYPIYPEYS